MLMISPVLQCTLLSYYIADFVLVQYIMMTFWPFSVMSFLKSFPVYVGTAAYTLKLRCCRYPTSMDCVGSHSWLR